MENRREMSKQFSAQELERFCRLVNNALQKAEDAGTISRAGSYCYVLDEKAGTVVVDCADSYDVQFIEPIIKDIIKLKPEWADIDIARDEYKIYINEDLETEEDTEFDFGSSVMALESAYQDGTLAEYVADYVAFGGSVEELKAIAAESTIVTPEDIDVAAGGDYVLHVDSQEDPYNEFMNIVVQSKLQSDKEVQDYIFDLYFCHQGEPEWDNAYIKFLDDFGKTTRDELVYRLQRQNSPVLESLNESAEDVQKASDDLFTVEEMMSGFVDNMSDDQIDREIKLFKRYASILGTKAYEKLVVLNVEDNYLFHPDSVDLYGETVEVGNRNVSARYYEEANMIFEINKIAGSEMLFFKDIQSANDYLSKYDSEDIDEGWMYGVNKDEEVLVENIHDALNYVDRYTNNKYDLLNKYLSENITREQKATLKKMLTEGAEPEELAKVFTYNPDDEDEEYDFMKVNGNVEDNEHNVNIAKSSLSLLETIREKLYNIQKSNSAYEAATNSKQAILADLEEVFELVSDLRTGEI